MTNVINSDGTLAMYLAPDGTYKPVPEAAAPFNGGGGGAHTHPESEVTDLVSDLSGKAASGHDHDGTYEPTHSHPYAATSHSHVDGDLPAGLARDAEVTSAIATHAATPHGGGGEAFPVGSVFLGVVSTNPATLLGYGTWAAFGAGRILIGRDTGQSAEDLLGNATHSHAGHTDHGALTHSGATVGDHSVTQPSAHADHTLSGAIAGEAAHTHAYTQTVNHVHPLATGTGTTGNFAQVVGTVDTSSGGTGGTPTQTALGTLSGNPSGGVASGTSAAGASHTHGNGTLAVSAHAAHAGTAVDAHSVGQASQHAAQSHSAHDSVAHLPPAIVVYMWKRTA